MKEIIAIIMTLLQADAPVKASVRAQLLNDSGFPQTGVILSLRSGAQYVGRDTSDIGGYLTFENVPAGSLRFYNTTEPRYTASGTGLRLAEEIAQLDVKLFIDRGDLNQTIAVRDANGVIGGATASLIWSKDYDGISAMTRRSNKLSDSVHGFIEFSHLSRGEHSVRVTKAGYQSVTRTIDVGVDPQTVQIILTP